MGYMYILLCADGTYYTGSTKDLKKRLQEHQSGCGAEYTSGRLPVQLVYHEEYQKISVAFRREKQIQRWSRRKKEALIEGDLTELSLAAKKVFRK
jgi:putative endonuclease